jgi:hypothetical protein
MESKLVQFAKWLITPESLTVTGSLTPKQSRSLISAIKKNNEFLKKINYQTMTSLEQFVDAFDIADGVLVRVPEGVEPSDADKKKYQNIGTTLKALAVNLFSDVTRSTLQNNADNKNLDQYLFDGFATKFGNELVMLGFKGVAETGDTFENLHKGWVQVAKDSADTAKDTYDAATEGILDRLKKLVKKIHPDAKGPGTSIIMSWADYEDYILALGGDTLTASIIANANTKSFMGYPIEVQKDMAEGEYLATPLKNLVFGAVTDVYRGREWNARKRCMEYTFDLKCDYEIVIKKWCAYVSAA